MILYGSQRVRHSAEKDVLAVLETVKTSDLQSKISFGVASVSFTPAYGQDREIDFLLVGPAGIYVLEAKGGEISIRDGMWYSKNHWGESNKIFPFEQAKSNFYELWRFMAAKGVKLDRDSIGHFSCVFPDYKLRALPDLAWAKEQYLDANFMRNPTQYINSLVDYTQNRFGSSRKLDESALKQIKALLVPNYKDYIRDISTVVDDKVLLLSEEQSIVFDALSDVKRMVIEGPPGSGKTILAIEQLLANEKAGIKTLYVCYNRALCNKVANDVRVRLKKEPGYLAVMTTTMLANHTEKYEYLVLDEAQDYLDDKELKTLSGLLKGGVTSGKFRIYLDENQDVFEASEKNTLNGLIARDDVVFYPLKYNYRNSAKINTFVRKMTPLRVGLIRNNPEGSEPEVSKIPYVGKSVDYVQYPKDVGAKINELLKSGVQPKEIMIVSISNNYSSVMSERNRTDVKLINGVKLSLGRDVDWKGFEKANTIIHGNAYDLKGLDSKIVVCTDVFTKADKEEALLVGMTRARSRLIVFTGKNV